MVNYTVRFTKMKLSHNWKLFGLLVSLTHLANGQVVFDLQGTSCKSENITLGCTINSFTTDATWKRGDGLVLAVTCSSAGPCSQVSQTIDGTTYLFQGNTSGIYMSTQLPPSEQGVNWTCTYSSNDYIYQFELGCSGVTTEGSTEGNQPCEDYHDVIRVWGGTHVCPVPVEVIIVIIIIIYDSQKVKITVTDRKGKKLKLVKQTINGVAQEDFEVNKITWSVDVLGGNTHQFEFTTDAGVILLKFQIKDDLLNATPGQDITLPTILMLNNEIDSTIPSIQWFHNKKKFRNNGLYFNTMVKWSTYGVYDIKMKFKDLVMIRIENMRVKARNWMVLIICVGVNVSLILIGGVVVESKRSTDGFCVSGTLIIIVCVVPICVYGIPVVLFIYLFFIKRTGNEQSSGIKNDQPNDVMINLKEKTSNESSLPENKGPLENISGRNNLLEPLRKETNSAQN